MPANPFQTANRLKKAVALADAIAGAGISPDDAAQMSAEQWSLAAAAAEVRMPSPITCQLVVLMLARREFARKLFSGKLQSHATAA